jgi:DNA (cytosine-5)-methyltransferase 1
MKSRSKKDIWDPSAPVEANRENWNEDPVLIKGDHSLVPTGSFTLVDLFCGCGGFSTGFEMGNFRSILATDINKPSVETFRRNHPWADVILGDMQIVENKLVEEAIGERRVDVIAAGVPCQGFSLNNRKRWIHDERNFLFKEFIRVVEILKPRIVILENVSGLMSSASGAFMHSIADAIASCGYNVDFDMLNAVDYGVPQKRRRVFFIGADTDIEIFWPKPTHGPGRPKPHVTVWEALGDLPQIGANESSSHYDKEPLTDYQRRMRRGCDDTLWNHEAPKHPPATVKKIAAIEPGKPIYPKFKQRIRLHPDRPSPTQVSGGIRPQFQFGHPKVPRGLTVRERCRIQSIPDSYYICGGVVQGRVQTGNAVPPLLARAIAEQISGMLRGEPRTDKTFPPRPEQMALFK